MCRYKKSTVSSACRKTAVISHLIGWQKTANLLFFVLHSRCRRCYFPVPVRKITRRARRVLYITSSIIPDGVFNTPYSKTTPSIGTRSIFYHLRVRTRTAFALCSHCGSWNENELCYSGASYSTLPGTVLRCYHHNA